MQKIPGAVEEDKRGLTGVIPVGKIPAFRRAKIRQDKCDAVLILGMERVDDALKRAAMFSRRVVNLNDGRLSSNGLEAGIGNV
jgi:hypothetical protein